jgi:hypothetical protein
VSYEPWDTPEAVAEAQEIHRAVGRYFVTFSAIPWNMRRALGGRLQSGDQLPYLVDTLLSDMMAMHLSRAFFGAALMLNTLDDDEQAVAKRLKNRLKAAIEERNELAHGDWMITHALDQDTGEWGPMETLITRFGLTKGDGRVELKQMPPTLLDARSDVLGQLASHVHVYGAVCLPALNSTEPNEYEGKRVRDVLRIEGNALVRADQSSSSGSG